MNEQTLQILIQSGAIGTNLVMLYVFLKIAKMFNETMRENNKQSLTAQSESAKSNVKLSESLSKLSDRIELCPHHMGKKHA